jgi:hypothetical protein
MGIAGRREKRTRLVKTERFVVSVDVEAVYPTDAPDEACFESEVVELLREVQQRAEAGDVQWLVGHGRVYQRVEAA